MSDSTPDRQAAVATRPVRALLSDIVDYAGLFPPAGLGMEQAVAEFARQRRSPDAWMLARFVVPAARLDELEEAMRALGDGLDVEAHGAWRLSALAGPDLTTSREQIESFHERAGTIARVETIELKAPAADVVERGARIFEDFDVFFEIAHEVDPTPLMRVVQSAGGAAKIRTGAVVADPIPSVAEVARFLRAAAAVEIPFKATAGLHHPVRAVYPLTYAEHAPRAEMHGFLNLFFAAALLDSGSLDEASLGALLEESDPRSFTVDGDSFAWRGRRLDADALERSRTGFARSFGSCSFSEPVEDLETLGFLGARPTEL